MFASMSGTWAWICASPTESLSGVVGECALHDRKVGHGCASCLPSTADGRRRSQSACPGTTSSRPGADEQLVREARYGARPPEIEPLPGRPAPAADRGAAAHRRRPPLLAPGRGAGERPRGPHDRHDRHGVGQVAGLQPAGARHARARPQGARDLPLPDQGARPGPGAQAHPAPGAVPAPRDLRRRHAQGRARRRSASGRT